MPNVSSAAELRDLEDRINALLPPRYAGCFEDVSPKSMGSAQLRYDKEGKVVWGEIWTTFCHLALAGGPPHRGRWLGPVPAEVVEASPKEYETVVAELKRALGLCVDLPLIPVSPPGWIGLQCDSAATAVWLVRAIVAENVIARNDGPILFVPAGPDFRVEKEIKNVIVCVAKCCHYLFDHLEPEQQPSGTAPSLIQPLLPHELADMTELYEQSANRLQSSIEESTGMKTLCSDLPGWVGMDCGQEETAVWLLRAIAVENILARRENATLFVPVDLRGDGEAIAVTASAVARAHRLSGIGRS
jgi:sirohydrochlorin cobaltochelatase